jgi:hypothetical protein
MRKLLSATAAAMMLSSCQTWGPTWSEVTGERWTIPSAGWTGGTDLETLKLDFAPCKRYYVNAKYDTRLSISWRPFVDYVEPIAGCTAMAAK